MANIMFRQNFVSERTSNYIEAIYDSMKALDTIIKKQSICKAGIESHKAICSINKLDNWQRQHFIEDFAVIWSLRQAGFNTITDIRPTNYLGC